jgi:hypothetical protein
MAATRHRQHGKWEQPWRPDLYFLSRLARQKWVEETDCDGFNLCGMPEIPSNLDYWTVHL